MGEEVAQDGDGQAADEGNSLWDWDEGDADCGWAVDDHDGDESNDELQMITTSAQYFVPGPKSDVSESEDEEEEDEEKEEFDVVTGNEGIAFESEYGPNYNPLSPPPARVSRAEPDGRIDPWSAGSDPWRRNPWASGSTSNFAETYRHVGSSPSAQSFVDRFRSPTSAEMSTRSLFDSPADETIVTLPPPEPVGVRVRRTQSVATNISVPEARRERFLPPCSCEFPPGIGSTPTGIHAVDFVSCSTQTHVIDVTSQCIQTVSEEGTSHLTDDGWAETQNQRSEISESLRNDERQVFHERDW